MIQASDVFKIGRFYKPHGIAGEITFAFSDDVFDRTESPYWLIEIDGILVPFFLESYRFCSDSTALVKMLDIDDEKQAKLLADRDVYYPKSYADTPMEDSEAFSSWHAYLGYRVIESETGNDYGTIDAVDDSTINVLFSVSKGGQTVIIPATDDFIERKDKKERILYMHFPEGLFQTDEEA